MDWLMDRFVEYDRLCMGSDIFRRRCDNIGVLKAADCITHGVTGPMLRAAGVRRDLRKDHPYAVYDRVEFDVAYADSADVTSRYIVRLEEVRQSVRIYARRSTGSTPIRARSWRRTSRVGSGRRTCLLRAAGRGTPSSATIRRDSASRRSRNPMARPPRTS